MLLDILGIIGFEWVAVDSAGTLEFTSEANGRGQLDDGGFVFDCFGSFNSGLHGIDIMVTILDMLSVPSEISSVKSLLLPVSFEAFQDIFGECTIGVSVDTDMIVIVYHDQVSQLQVAGERSGFTSNTFLSATITEIAVSVVVFH